MNYPSTFRDSAVIAIREAEVPDADFSGGANSGSNCGGLGVATQEHGFKHQDFSQSTPEVLVKSQYIGGVQSGVEILAPNDDVGIVALMLAGGDVVADAVIGVVEGFDMANVSGETILAGELCFGANTNP